MGSWQREGLNQLDEASIIVYNYAMQGSNFDFLSVWEAFFMAGTRVLTRDIAYQGIRDAVISGELSPGEQVTEIVLASRFGLSRTPLREAIQRLESEELMIRQPNGTIIVAPLDLTVMNELFNIAERLEGLVAISLAHAKKPSLINQLIALIHYETACIDHGNLKDAISVNGQFHHLLWEHSDVGFTVKILYGFDAFFERFLRLTPSELNLEEFIRTIHAEHKLIIEAIQAGDSVWSEMAVKANNRTIKKFLFSAYTNKK